MARSAASKAERAAAALDDYLRDQAPSPTRQVHLEPRAPAEIPSALIAAARSDPPPPDASPGRGTDPPLLTGAPLQPAHTDWLYHRLQVTGPAAELDGFRHAAAGAGTIPWQLDLQAAEEDWFHLLATPARRDLSLTASRMLAAQLREAVERRHALAVARVGHSRACPLDLHALVPVPSDILRLGPDHPHAQIWLWQHWGTTEPLRHVAPRSPDKEASAPGTAAGESTFRIGFWAADWTPWRAFERIQAEWPALRFEVRPDYTVP